MLSAATKARNYYRSQQKVALAAVRATRKAIRAATTPPQATTAATTTVATYQLASALNGARTMAGEFGRDMLAVPARFMGTTQLGWPIETPIETIVSRLTDDLEGDITRLTDQMMAGLDMFVQSEVIAAGADAASVEIAHERVSYVRVLVPPSCDRCTILAGHIYRSADAFERHPRCDCEHWPVGSEEEARAKGLLVDPMEAYEKGQIGSHRVMPDGSTRFVPSLSKADMRAIGDGADIGQIVNARRAGIRAPAGITNAVSADIFGRTVKATTAGTTKRSAWRKAHPNLPIRLRPQSIYAHAKDHDDAIRLLKLYGYIT